MRSAAALLLVGLAIAGCGSSARPTPMTGCRGLPTASKSTSFLVLFGSTNNVTQRIVCAKFGAPQKITRHGDRLVDWTYGKAVVTFRGQQVVGYTTADSKGTNTYSFSQSLHIQS